MRRLIAVCCAVVFLDTTFFSALVPLLPSLKEDFGMSEGDAGLLTGVYGAGVLIAAVPAGWFASKVGGRTALLSGLVGIGAFSVLFGLADRIWLLELARFCQGISGALLWSGAISWVVVAGPVERRGMLIGLIAAAATVGELAGAPLGALAHLLGLDVVFIGVAVLAMILLLVVLTLPAPKLQADQLTRALLRRSVDPLLLRTLFLLAVAATTFGVVTVVAPLRLADFGAGALAIAGAFVVGSVIESIAGPQVGRLSDRIGRIRPFQIGAVIAALAVTGLAALQGVWVLSALVALFALGAAFAFTPAMALAADVADAVEVPQGWAAGLGNIAFGGGQMVGAIAAGLLGGAGHLLPALVCVVLLLAAAFSARDPGGAAASSER